MFALILAALAGPIQTTASERDVIRYLADAKVIAAECSDFIVDDRAAAFLLMSVRIAPSELEEGGRRFGIFEDELGRATAFIYQFAEDYEWSRESAACLFGTHSYGPAGAASPDLLIKRK